jgi:RNA polymerase sigma factor (sigma-70 family)
MTPRPQTAGEDPANHQRSTTGKKYQTPRTNDHGDDRGQLTTNQTEKGPENMSRNQITTTLSEPGDTNAYLGELEQILRRMTPKRTQMCLDDINDFVQYFLIWAWKRVDLMEKYEPQALASVAFNQRLIDFRRQNGRQLPQGEFDNKTGKVVNAIWSLDHVLFQDGDDEFTLGDVLEGNEDWLERVLAIGAVQTALEVLTPAQREIFILVEGLQFKVTEVAKMRGYKREWAQRELGKARAALTEYAQAWD